MLLSKFVLKLNTAGDYEKFDKNSVRKLLEKNLSENCCCKDARIRRDLRGFQEDFKD
jgi:hypothetical protein